MRFPISAFNKVTNVLNEKYISYDEVNFKKRNKYNIYVELGKKKYSIDYRIKCILDKINSLNESEIDDILNFIESKL